MSESAFGVLLVRKVGNVVDTTFAYRNDRLPEFGDEIEVSRWSGGQVLVKVTGVEKAKTLPIRATEL